MGHGNFLNSTGRHEHFFNSTGRHNFLKIDRFTKLWVGSIPVAKLPSCQDLRHLTVDDVVDHLRGEQAMELSRESKGKVYVGVPLELSL